MRPRTPLRPPRRPGPSWSSRPTKAGRIRRALIRPAADRSPAQGLQLPPRPRLGSAAHTGLQPATGRLLCRIRGSVWGAPPSRPVGGYGPVRRPEPFSMVRVGGRSRPPAQGSARPAFGRLDPGSGVSNRYMLRMANGNRHLSQHVAERPHGTDSRANRSRKRTPEALCLRRRQLTRRSGADGSWTGGFSRASRADMIIARGMIPIRLIHRMGRLLCLIRLPIVH